MDDKRDDTLPKTSAPSDSPSETYAASDDPPESHAVPKDVSELTLKNSSASDSSASKEKTFKQYCSESVIINFIVFLCVFIGKLCRRSLTASVLTSYHSASEAFSSSAISGSRVFGFFSKLSRKLKRYVQKLVSYAVFPHAFDRLSSTLLAFKTASYGLVLLFFSLGTALIYLLERLGIFIGNLDIYAPVSAAVILIVAIMLLLNKGSLAHALQESVIGSFVFFTLLGIDRPSDDTTLSPFGSGACIIGALLSLLTFFVPAHLICVFILFAIYTAVMLKSPETAFISLILVTPFVSQGYAVYICSMSIVSYVLKVLCGKRSLKFEFMDLFVFAFLAIMFFGEAFTLGGSGRFYVPILYTAAYFIAVNILKSSVWFKRTISTVIFSAVVISFYAAFVLVFKNIISLPIDLAPQTDIGNSDVTIFASLSLLGVVVIYSIFFLLSEFLISTSNTRKITMFFIAAFALFFVFSSLSPAAKIATGVSVILFFMFYSKKTAAIFTSIIVVLSLALLFIPGFYAQIIDLFKAEHYRADIWNAVIYMLTGSALPESSELSGSVFTLLGLTGAGAGNGAFKDIFSVCYPGSSGNITHAHSLFLQLIASYGLIGVIVFLMIVFFIIQNCFSFGRCCINKNVPSRIYNYAGLSAVISLLLCGVGEYIWYNPRVVLIFWIICAISVSAKRSADFNDANYFQFGKYKDYDELT
ncbi:MAG: hypothetical protein E7634_04145 [Ruminococcaceae bacterium]|nr:hypothetical protein [Oscillospiraceae bacterium]